VKFDQFDREILRLLQSGGYCAPKAAKLAKVLKKPTTSLYDRIKRMEKQGIIARFAAVPNSKQAGFGITAYMLGGIKPGTDMEEVAQELLKIPNVLELHFLSGEWDFMIKFKVKDIDEYYEVSAHKFLKSAKVERLKGLIAPKTFKEDLSVPV